MPANEIKIDVEIESDPRGLDKLAADAKQGAAKAGDNIVQELERAGGRAEAEARQMADAISNRLSDMPKPRFEDQIVRPAQQAGEAAGDAIGEGMAAVDVTSVGNSVVEGLAMLGPIGAAAGMAVGEELAAGIDHGFNSRRNAGLDAVRSGLPESEIASIGRDAGEAYSDGFGEGLRQMEQNGQLIANTMQGIDEALDMDEALRAAAVLQEMWGIEIPESLQIARDLITSGLAPDTVTAYAQMADAQQRYQLDAEELNGVMEEFSSFMGRLGMDGSTAWKIIGDATRENLFPTVDRAGEMFEEFVISMQEGSTETQAAIRRIGLDWDEMQALFNSGRGDEALARISTALLEVESDTDRNTAALAIFKMAFEGATDPERVLELYAMADATTELGTALGDATGAAERGQTSLDKLKTWATEGGSDLGRMVNDGLNPLIVGLQQAGGLIENVFGSNDAATESTNAWTDAVIAAAHETEKWSQYGDYWIEAMGEGSAATDDATSSVQDLDAAFSELQNRFDGDQAIRGLHDQIRELAEAEIDAAATSYELGVGFDQTTEAGGAIAAQLEDLHGNLVDVAEAHRDGTATAQELAGAQASTEAALRDVAAQLGLTEAETRDLIARYGEVPEDISTDVSLTGSALADSGRLLANLRAIGNIKAFPTVTTQYYSTGKPSTFTRVPGFGKYAAGGVVDGLAGGGMSMATVNDGAGGESAWLPNGNVVMLPTGSKVNSHEDTERMALDAANRGDGGRVVIELRSAGSALDDVLLEVLRKAIRNQGGGVVQVLG